MMHFSLVLLLCFFSWNAAAEEGWTCIAGNGEEYQTTQSIPGLVCRFGELPPKPPQKPEPLKKSFCTDSKIGTCTGQGSGQDEGTVGSIRFRVFQDSAEIDATEGPDGQTYEPAAKWDVSCSRDKMTNRRTCMINQGDLYLFLYQNKTELVSVGTDHFPGSTTALKIGSARYDTAHRDGNFVNSSALLAQMKDDKVAVSRYMKWPYRYWVDKEFKLRGIELAVKTARWLLINGKLD